ncbi:DUF742 domain-containing protein [Peterkaempfera bronchialis]|uniref:DUF742 domain-containing protein n=1 Tax=Peterkaempfera bronchialis TaxID=2126346 RepID=UPI003C3083EC
MSPPRRAKRGGLVAPYVITGGRGQPSRNTLDLVTLMSASPHMPTVGLGPEQQRIMRLCRPGTLTVAEVSAHLDLPLGPLKVLLADLIDSGHLAQAPTRSTASLPDRALLEDVLAGLKKL